MKKAIALALSLCLAFSLAACSGGGKATPAEVYTFETDFVEAGYEGDCINTNAYVLVLNSDGTYTFIHNFFVNQVSGVIVAFTKTTYTGTYTAGEASDGVKTVTLAAPTSGTQNANGGVTTSAEDAEILSGFEFGTITVDANTGTLSLG